MECQLCGAESNVIYTTSKYGFICNKCMYKITNSEEEKLKQEIEKIEMHRKYRLC